MITLFFLALLLFTCSVAFARGRKDEKLAAGAMFTATIASPVALSSGYTHPESGILIVDLALLAILVVLALRSDRFWPLWATGFHMVGTSIHLATFADSGIWPPAYAAAEGFWAWPVLTALLVGTWLEARYRSN